MKNIFFLSILVMLLQAAGVSQACVALPENMPILTTAEYASPVTAASPDTFTDSNSGIEFVRVSGGCYCMGAADKKSASYATPVHEACVDDYYMGKYEVTRAQWKAIMGNAPSAMSSCGDNCPVVDVSWDEVQQFTRRLSELTGKVFRLPTEAEWEHAVHGGGTQEKNITASAASDFKNELRPVGWSQPNGFGIYDMQGSVWEWTGDRYRPNYYEYGKSSTDNPAGPSRGIYRVLRGGSWNDSPQSIKPTHRITYESWTKRPWVGFRLLSPDQAGVSAKNNLRETLAQKEKASRNSQCPTVQQALSR